MRSAYFLIALAFVVLFSSCQEEKVPAPFKPRNDHEAYQNSLDQANLLSTALGSEWQQSAEKSLESPISINAPYEEAFYLDPREARAVSYRFAAKRGQKIQVAFTQISEDSARLFVDLYRIVEKKQFRHVATADKENLMLGFEPRVDADYVLRFQPELLRGGQFKVTIANVPTLQFPVAGKTTRAIGSFWGAPRDGGRRKHEGVDIFAKRGTPVVAPVDGYVRFVGERGIGGKVVWLRDTKRGQSLYFAHLNELIAEQGTYVEAGDTLGTVGNTGNARTTPPHLHFGVYKNGAVDPIFYLRDPSVRLKKVGTDIGLLGAYARLNRSTSIKSDPNQKKSDGSIAKNEITRILAINNNAYRVQLATGKEGYVRKRFLTGSSVPIEMLSLSAEGDLLKRPDEHTFGALLEPGDEVAVLGRHEDFWFVRNQLGEMGWISDEQKKAQRAHSDSPD